MSVLSESRRATRPRAAAIVAALGAVAVILTGAVGCSSAGSGSRPSKQVLLTSGVYDGVWWGVWAWTEGKTLCMGMAGHGGPNDSTPPAQDASGAACGFARTPSYPHFYDSGPGPAGSGFSIGPLPAAATQIRVASHEILATTAFPAGDGLPAARYWVEIIPATGIAEADGAPLGTPQPLNASGQPVPFRAY
jgi:hypothetical protein